MNCRSKKRSYKLKIVDKIPRDKWLIFEDTHEAIVSKEDFALVQQIREHRVKHQKREKQSPFSGMCYCADCGHLMYLSSSVSGGKRYEHLKCGANANDKTLCSTHYMRADVLYEIVLNEVRKVVSQVTEREDEFVKAALEKAKSESEKALKTAHRQLEKAEKRIGEIDRIISSLYEDKLNGEISSERFKIMSADYEREQAELKTTTVELREAISQAEQKNADTAEFIKIVKKYAEIPELTNEIVHEFIERIVIHSAEKIDGKRRQKIEIYFRFNAATSTITA